MHIYSKIQFNIQLNSTSNQFLYYTNKGYISVFLAEYIYLGKRRTPSILAQKSKIGNIYFDVKALF